ncbi:MAG: hypothetical protein MI919_04690, partial [Holophagales bacterium]|nr:hypothetical protein [Holophagales bacterium]
MDRRLGELLIAEGRLSPDQLDRALESQGLVGNRLGTNLIELDLMREEVLSEALGRLRSTKTASVQELERIPASVIKLIPEKLARRYRLVPYLVKGNTLFVASTDPGDALREDEIGFLTSLLVRTSIALEIRLHIALRQYYGVRLEGRMLTLARRLLRQRRPGEEGGAPSSSPPPSSSSRAPSSPALPSPSPGLTSPGLAPPRPATSTSASTIPGSPSAEGLSTAALEASSDPHPQPPLAGPQAAVGMPSAVPEAPSSSGAPSAT